MARTLIGFDIKEVWRIHRKPDIYCGDVTLSFAETIEDREYVHHVTVRARIRHPREDSVATLEQRFLEAARDLLGLAAERASEETAEQLSERFRGNG